MKVEIHSIIDQTFYVANSVESCKDNTDKSIFEEVVKSNDVVTMGMYIGKPIYSPFDDTMELHNSIA